MTRFIVYSRWGQYKGELRVYRAMRTRATDGTDELEISSVEAVEKGDRIVFYDSMARACEYSADQPQTSREGTRGGCTVRCNGSMLSDLKLKKVDDIEATCTASQALESALEGTGWEPGHVDAGRGAQAIVWHEMMAVTAIRNICDVYGLEVEQRVEVDGAHITKRYVDLFNRRGRDTARRFEYGRDLRGIRRTVSSTPVYTRLYCYGKTLQGEENKTAGGYSKRVDITSVNGGRAYVEDVEATAVWGLPDGKGGKIPAEGIYENGDCEDPAQLLAEGNAALKENCEPKVTYEADVVALQRAGFDADGVDIGDGVQIVDTAFPGTVRLMGRVLSISENLLGGLIDTTITLGNISKTLTQQNAEAQEAIDRLAGSAGAWDSAATVQDSFINSVINGLNSVLNEVGGYSYLVPGQGLFVYDKPIDEDPTMVIMLGGGYLRIADGKNSQGEWNWRTAATGHGMVADELVVGTITGGSNSWNLETGDLLFQQGGIRDSQGANYWNLTTGDFKLSPGALVGDEELGKTTVSTEVQYGHSASADVKPTDWGSDGTWRQGEYLWSRVKCTAIDGTVTYQGEKVIANDKGMGGTTTPQWYLSTSETAQVGGSWQDSQPSWVEGHYYWTRNKTTWSDGTTTYDTPVLAHGVTDANQSVNDLDESLDVEGVFNRLTNNGALKGIYLENGELYINATYLVTGILSDIKKKNFWNLQTGDFSLSSATTVGGQTVDNIAGNAADDALNSANEYTDALDDELDQSGVFNRLTGDGAVKGIIMQDGQLYINASYINSGVLNADLLTAGRIKSKKGGTYWDLDTGEMVLDFSSVEDAIDDAVGDLSSDISELSSRITTAQNKANSAANAASAAQSTADTANSKATSAKAKTDKITFTSSGITVQGTNGKTTTCMTYGSDGIASAGSFAGIETSQATMTIKNWGFYAGSNSGDVRMYVTKGLAAGGTGDPVFVAETTGVSFLVSKDGVYLNNKKLAFE